MGRNGSKWCPGLEDLEPFCFEKMCFWTVLDHLDAILVHFEQNLKIDFFSDFLTILGPFWPFLDPKMASGAQKDSGEPTKIGQMGVKGPYKCVLGPF